MYYILKLSKPVCKIYNTSKQTHSAHCIPLIWVLDQRQVNESHRVSLAQPRRFSKVNKEEEDLLANTKQETLNSKEHVWSIM